MSDFKREKMSSPSVRVNRNPSLKVGSKVANAIRNGHPWIFRNGIQNFTVNKKDGAIVDVSDENNNFLGRGFFCQDGAIAVRIMTKKRTEKIDKYFIKKYVDKALSMRESLKSEGLTTYRIINGEAEHFPGITITRFGDYLHSIIYTSGVSAFKDNLYEYLLNTTGLKGIYEQERLKPLSTTKEKIPGRRVMGESMPSLLIDIIEDGLRYEVDLTAPAGVGFFPDYRDGRRLIKSMSAGKKVLNLFSYTGSFTLSALTGGASEVVSVDISQKANNIAKKHCEINKMDMSKTRFITEDASLYVSKLTKRQERFDLIIVDPPVFAKTSTHVWSIDNDYHKLIANLCQIVKPGGYILLTSNASKMSNDDFERIIAYGGRFSDLLILKRINLPIDYPQLPAFPEGRYLKSYLIRVN